MVETLPGESDPLKYFFLTFRLWYSNRSARRDNLDMVGLQLIADSFTNHRVTDLHL